MDKWQEWANPHDTTKLGGRLSRAQRLMMFSFGFPVDQATTDDPLPRNPVTGQLLELNDKEVPIMFNGYKWVVVHGLDADIDKLPSKPGWTDVLKYRKSELEVRLWLEPPKGCRRIAAAYWSLWWMSLKIWRYQVGTFIGGCVK